VILLISAPQVVRITGVSHWLHFSFLFAALGNRTQGFKLARPALYQFTRFYSSKRFAFVLLCLELPWQSTTGRVAQMIKIYFRFWKFEVKMEVLAGWLLTPVSLAGGCSFFPVSSFVCVCDRVFYKHTCHWITLSLPPSLPSSLSLSPFILQCWRWNPGPFMC
jgi:hypothetical protein